MKQENSGQDGHQTVALYHSLPGQCDVHRGQVEGTGDKKQEEDGDGKQGGRRREGRRGVHEVEQVTGGQK